MQAPLEFVPQSEQITFKGPRTAKKRHRALIKLDVSIDYKLNMHSTYAKACKDNRPPFTVHCPSSCVMSGDGPGAEHVQAYICKRGFHAETVGC